MSRSSDEVMAEALALDDVRIFGYSLDELRGIIAFAKAQGWQPPAALTCGESTQDSPVHVFRVLEGAVHEGMACQCGRKYMSRTVSEIRSRWYVVPWST